jgi:hypothetical protein
MIYALSIGQAAGGAVKAGACRRGPWRQRTRPRRGSPGGSPSRLATSHSPLPTTAVKPSPTQSHLVKPSPTFNFRPSSRPPAYATASIRGICVIRGRNSSPFVPIRVDLWLPPSTQPAFAKASAAQYGLIRPNTALNSPGKAGSGQKEPTPALWLTAAGWLPIIPRS